MSELSSSDTVVRIPTTLRQVVRESEYIESASVVLRRLIEQYAAGEVSLNRTKAPTVQVCVSGVPDEVREKAKERAKSDGVSFNAAVVDLLSQFIRDHEQKIRAFEKFCSEHKEAA